jgi:hypothetical protein
VLGVGTLWHLQKFLQYLKYITLELIPLTILLYPLSSHSWNSFFFELGSHNNFAWVSFRLQSSYLHLPHSWDYSAAPPCLCPALSYKFAPKEKLQGEIMAQEVKTLRDSSPEKNKLGKYQKVEMVTEEVH